MMIDEFRKLQDPKKKPEYKGIYLKLNKEDDKDVIGRLQKQENKQGYIKNLIRDDITLDIFREGVENGSVKVKRTKDNNNHQGQ
jgi:hypothetical protein